MPDSAPASRLKTFIEIGSVIAFALFVAHKLIAAGSPGEQPALIVSALLFTAFGLIHGAHMLGWRRTVTFFSITSIGSWIAETHSIKSGSRRRHLHLHRCLGPKVGHGAIRHPTDVVPDALPAYVIANRWDQSTHAGAKRLGADLMAVGAHRNDHDRLGSIT